MRKAYDDGQPVLRQITLRGRSGGKAGVRVFPSPFIKIYERGREYPSPRPLALYYRVQTYLAELAYRKACALRVYYGFKGGMFSAVCGRIEFSALDSHCS
jgi:hypothetical protein